MAVRQKEPEVFGAGQEVVGYWLKGDNRGELITADEWDGIRPQKQTQLLHIRFAKLCRNPETAIREAKELRGRYEAGARAAAEQRQLDETRVERREAVVRAKRVLYRGVELPTLVWERVPGEVRRQLVDDLEVISDAVEAIYV